MLSTVLRPFKARYNKGKKIELNNPYPSFSLFFKFLLKNKCLSMTIDSTESLGFENVWYVDWELVETTPKINQKNEKYYDLDLYVREYSGDFCNKSPGEFKYFPDREDKNFERNFEGKLNDMLGDGFDLDMSEIAKNIFQSFDKEIYSIKKLDLHEIKRKKILSERILLKNMINQRCIK